MYVIALLRSDVKQFIQAILDQSIEVGILQLASFSYIIVLLTHLDPSRRFSSMCKTVACNHFDSQWHQFKSYLMICPRDDESDYDTPVHTLHRATHFWGHISIMAAPGLIKEHTPVSSLFSLWQEPSNRLTGLEFSPRESILIIICLRDYITRILTLE